MINGLNFICYFLLKVSPEILVSCSVTFKIGEKNANDYYTIQFWDIHKNNELPN